ncbi:MAG: PilZ domain-containing protein [Saprospiraceae bacterium]|nr:PilZ domain-containing protein [Saprospiraceae bacterium]
MERRDKARLPYVCPISVKDLMSGESCSARMFNYSDTGIYFESDALLESGTEVYIGLRHSPFEDLPSDYTCYRTTLMWRKELEEDAHFFYGYGTQVLPPESPGKAKSNRKQRRHPRRPLNRQVRFAADNTIIEGHAVDISPSGVFVKSGKRVHTGQIITLRIPDKTGKDVFVQGKVVWSNADGFGLKFILK